MLEARLKLNKAMEEDAPIEEVEERFVYYCSIYDRIKHPNEKNRKKHKQVFFNYLDYINRMEEEKQIK